MSAPSKDDIVAAERRLAASRERTRMAVRDLRMTAQARKAEFNAKMAKPSALMYALAVGVVIGKTLLKRKPRMPAPPRRRANELTGGIVASLAAALSRVGWRFASAALLKMLSARTRVALPPPRRPAQPASVAPLIQAPPRSAGETVH